VWFHGELLFVEHGSGYVMNVLTDMYVNRLDDEITKLLKKKEKLKEIYNDSFQLKLATDWKGNPMTKTIDGY